MLTVTQIHLHGHDFAILQQIGATTFPKGLNLTKSNPPRRDVVLLPTDGYVVIAFKADNPGTWLTHCHIADHASLGLGLQIMERQKAATIIWPDRNHSHALQVAQKGCNTWNEWWGNCTNWWPGNGTSCPGGEPQFSPDSGI
jgi:Multicopper oxidase